MESLESQVFPEVSAKMDHTVQTVILVLQVQLDPRESQGARDQMDLM